MQALRMLSFWRLARSCFGMGRDSCFLGSDGGSIAPTLWLTLFCMP